MSNSLGQRSRHGALSKRRSREKTSFYAFNISRKTHPLLKKGRCTFEGAGDFPVAEQFDFSNNSFARMTVKTTYAFSQPGTYFPVLRGSSHRTGDFKAKFARISNIGRVRVVVKEGR